MSFVFARLYLPGLVIAMIAAIAVITYLVLMGQPADERLLGPFRWIGTGARLA
jgi:hypothetical protein